MKDLKKKININLYFHKNNSPCIIEVEFEDKTIIIFKLRKEQWGLGGIRSHVKDISEVEMRGLKGHLPVWIRKFNTVLVRFLAWMTEWLMLTLNEQETQWSCKRCSLFKSRVCFVCKAFQVDSHNRQLEYGSGEIIELKR